MHTLVVVSDAVKKRVETTYEENANRDAEVPVGVGGAGAVNITLAVALAEGRNAVKRSPSLGEGGPSVSEGPKIHFKKTGMSEHWLLEERPKKMYCIVDERQAKHIPNFSALRSALAAIKKFNSKSLVVAKK
ncbi:hypothetical protein ACFX13_024346 [Malus domestica]